MIRNSIFTGVPILGAALLLGGAGCSGQNQPAPIFLGQVATFSGPDAKAAKAAEAGIKLALEEMGPAASENLNGRPIVVRHVDAGGNLDNLEAEAARLVSINRVVGLLGGLSVDEALRLDRCRVPVLSPLGFRTSAMSELLFTTGLSPAAGGQALGQYLAEEKSSTGILIIDPRREEALALAESFRRAWTDTWQKKNAKAGPPRWTELMLPKDVQVAEWASVAIKDEPKIAVVATSAADCEMLRKAWGAAVPLVIYAGEDGSLRSPESISGQTLMIATAFAVSKDAARVNDFVKKYRDVNREDPDVHAALAYDNVRLFVEALKKGQSPAAEKIREELLKIQDFAGLTGPLTFTREQSLRRPAFVAQVQGAGRAPTALKSYSP